MDQIFEVVGIWTGHIGHIREAGAALTLCGLGTVGWLAKRFFWPSQVNCKDCLDRHMKDNCKGVKHD